MQALRRIEWIEVHLEECPAFWVSGDVFKADTTMESYSAKTEGDLNDDLEDIASHPERWAFIEVHLYPFVRQQMSGWITLIQPLIAVYARDKA